jgi:hypothetical protein
MAWVYCDKCGKRTSDKQIQVVCVSDRSHWSPAEYEQWCFRCAAPAEDRDEAYERAAASYDGDGPDWR